MLNLNRRDRLADPARNANTVLKPAVYDPPGSANTGGSSRAASVQHGADAPGAPRPPSQPQAPAASSAAAKAASDAPESKLFVGVNIKLKGVEITDCDTLVIEGQVEATVHSKAMEIARPGTLKGNAQIDVAEIHGEFVGELTARTRLVVHGTGRVTGTIRYGKLVIAEGGEITGDVKRLEAAEGVHAPGSPALAGSALPQAARPSLSPSAERWSN
ncbi:MAG TPA: polymer-forming cytoskeletal protein [Casimicrobiaceae bacterium]|nr:polymer-forming cytoskeletal protein [Casimicrobiaceae bacterium]